MVEEGARFNYQQVQHTTSVEQYFGVLEWAYTRVTELGYLVILQLKKAVDLIIHKSSTREVWCGGMATECT